MRSAAGTVLVWAAVLLLASWFAPANSGADFIFGWMDHTSLAVPLEGADNLKSARAHRDSGGDSLWRLNYFAEGMPSDYADAWTAEAEGFSVWPSLSLDDRTARRVGIGSPRYFFLTDREDALDGDVPIGVLYRRESLYLGFGLSSTSESSSSMYIEDFDFTPRLHLLGGIRSDSLTLLPSLTLTQHELEEASDGDTSTLGWLIEVPVALRAGYFGARLSAHYGVNVGNVYERYYRLGYGGQNADGSVFADLEGETVDTRGYGGYLDISFGGKPLAVHVIGGIQVIQNERWKSEKRNRRWAAVIRVPYEVSGYFVLSPEVGYYVYGDEVNVQPGDDKDLGSEWHGGVKFEFLF